MSEFLNLVDRQLTEIEAETKDMPPGDERNRRQWVTEQVRDYWRKGEIARSEGKEVRRIENIIHQLMSKYL